MARLQIFFSLLVGIVFFLIPSVGSAAFGISPPFLNTDHLVPGAVYTQTVYLVQDQPTVDLPIKATLTVPTAIASWFSIDKGFNFTIPAGVHQFPVQVTITVPKDASLGKYSGSLVFATAPSQSGQVTIALGANVAINITVGNGVFEQYSIPYITLPSIEAGWNPRVTFRFENDGNIPEGIDSATFQIYDQYDSVQLAYLTKDDGFPTIPPFTTEEYTIQFPNNFYLGVGDYWGSVTFFKNNQAVASQKTIFHVLPPGSLSSPLDMAWEDIMDYWVYYFVGIIILLVIGRYIWIVRRKKKANSKA